MAPGTFLESRNAMISRPASASSGSASVQRPVGDGRNGRERIPVECRHRAGRNDDEPRVHGADERDEQADAHADGAAQVERNRLHHRLANARKHQREHDQAVQHHQPHGRLPRAGLARRPETRRPRSAPCRVPARSENSRPAPSGACRSPRQPRLPRSGRLERDSRRCEDRRIGEQDVRHRQERGDAAADLARRCRARAWRSNCIPASRISSADALPRSPERLAGLDELYRHLRHEPFDPLRHLQHAGLLGDRVAQHDPALGDAQRAASSTYAGLSNVPSALLLLAADDDVDVRRC